MSSSTLKQAVTGQIAPEQARDPYQQLKGQLERSRAEFLPLLGTPANVDKFFRVVLNAVVATPDLLNADRRSLILACSRAAQDGLLPDGREAVLNIYNTKVKTPDGREHWEKRAQYLPMVGGLIKKLYESGLVTYVDAVCVYKGDRFVYRRGDAPAIEHEPMFESSEFDDITHAYCIVKLTNGETKREVMGRKDIERVRGASKSAGSGPWVTWFDQQAIKSVVKRIYKQLPKADSFEAIERSDNEASGYVAGAGSTIGSEIGAIAQSRADAAAAPPPAAPAIEHNPSETLDMGMPLTTGGDEPVYAASAGGDGSDHHAAGADAPAQTQAPAEAARQGQLRRRGAAPAAQDRPAAPAGKTFDQLAAAIKQATGAETAYLLLDADGRHLPAEQQTDLARLIKLTFEGVID